MLHNIGLRGYSIGQWKIGVHTYLLLLWFIIFVIVFWRIKRTRQTLSPLSNIFNVIAFTLMIIVAVQFIRCSNSFTLTVQPPALQGEMVLAWTPPNDLDPLPDIYFIILDGYSRHDVLKSEFDYDNSSFLDYLQRIGFYVVEKSRSNYMVSALSITSVLNMDYLDNNRKPEQKQGSTIHHNLRKKYINNKVFQAIKKCGYETVVFYSGYDFTDRLKSQADLYITPGWHLNNFEEELLSMTPLVALKNISTLSRWQPKLKLEQRARMVLFSLNQLRHTPSKKQPLFVIAHIMSPHAPFIFAPDGKRKKVRGNHHRVKELSTENELTNEYKTGYTEQTSFVNNKISEFLNDILDRDGIKPTIVLISDHGNRFMKSQIEWTNETAIDMDTPFLNLCAIYFSDGDYQQLYPALSLVNVFRVVFNKYMKMELPLLEDRSYIYTGARSNQFIPLDQFKEKQRGN